MKSIDSFEDEYRDMTTPAEELWLQDRRAYSIPLPIHEGAPGSDMFKLFNNFTQLYSNLPGIKARCPNVSIVKPLTRIANFT